MKKQKSNFNPEKYFDLSGWRGALRAPFAIALGSVLIGLFIALMRGLVNWATDNVSSTTFLALGAAAFLILTCVVFYPTKTERQSWSRDEK